MWDLLLDFETVPIVWYYYFLSLFVLVFVFVLQYILIDLLKCFFLFNKKDDRCINVHAILFKNGSKLQYEYGKVGKFYVIYLR